MSWPRRVRLEIFSDSLGSYPADNWRWGAGTTDPVFPSSIIEFQGASEDTMGATQHPVAGFMEDRWDMGGGPVDDVGRAVDDIGRIGKDAVFRQRFLRALGEHVVAAGDADQLADPANACDQRFVPFFEVDARAAAQ